ncbi:hypothetical protein AB0I77_46460 [Streptomyces sp. NPDC050619]|uniref:hypothetical protein n=1 Tax=Streptomyces sp. NPDC050619 TaxID=3157214 RepID=UPI00344A9F2A
MTGILAQPPTDASWVFGERPHGTEPLTLPRPGEALDASGPLAHEAIRSAALLLRPSAHRPAGTWPGRDDQELFWSRWITGHQVCFLLWRLVEDLCEQEDAGQADNHAQLAGCVHAYNAMLLYCASCPSKLYNDLIRSAMRLHHPAFSGGWAPEFRGAVMRTFRSRRPPSASGAGTELDAAVRQHGAIHKFVASLLVPEGGSLLQDSGVSPWNADVRGHLFDTFFLTVRGPLTRGEFLGQLLRRAVAITRDLSVHGLRLGEVMDSGRTRHPGLPPDMATRAQDIQGALRRAVSVAVAHYAPMAALPSDPASVGTSELG